MISNHFLCKGLVHHPIDFQPFINGWPQGVPGWFLDNRNFSHSALVSGSISVLPELTLVLGPPIPSWGVEQGFDADFTGHTAAVVAIK